MSGPSNLDGHERLEVRVIDLRDCAFAFREHLRAVESLRRRVDPALLATIERSLGDVGRMIAPSKSTYRAQFPDHFVLFNANLLVSGKKAWWGDIDITLDEPTLVALAKEVGEVHVLHERDARFEWHTNPAISRFVYRTDGTDCVLGRMTSRLFERRRGRIWRRQRRAT